MFREILATSESNWTACFLHALEEYLPYNALSKRAKYFNVYLNVGGRHSKCSLFFPT